MYRLNLETRSVLYGYLSAGYPIRASARLANCAVTTARRYVGDEARHCTCGKEAGHKGWCSWRFLQSPVRQEYMRQWAERRRLAAKATVARSRPLAEYWPFIDVPLDETHLVLVRIGEIIPRALSEEVRREVGQDMATALLTGEIL